ncbi:hypothetical protein DL96DRAFT_1426901, partial [Flagelloscypha sp. PMI_526]
LLHKGIYTPTARSLARWLVHFGCSQKRVGIAIQKVASVFGIPNAPRMSPDTVRRAITEGGIASTVQLGREMAGVPSLTMSVDGTSHKHQEFEGQHVHLRVPNYSQGETMANASSTPVTRVLGVVSLTGKSADVSLDGLENQINGIGELAASAPSSKWGDLFTFTKYLKSLRGMMSDHASAEKSKAEKIASRKHNDAIQELGAQEILDMAPEELRSLLHRHAVAKIEGVGGFQQYMEMDPVERAHLDAAQHETMKRELGEELYGTLDQAAREELDIFLWAGCCCHKDQNSFEGGNREMVGVYKKFGLVQPVLLANKADTATIARILDPSHGAKPLSPDETITVEKMTKGGAKLCALAGALFGNKDDKKGLGDDYSVVLSGFYQTPVGQFSRVHHSRFGSVGEAAADLLEFHSGIVSLLEDVRDGKTKVSWTNLEKNIYNGLHDNPTLAELCVLTIYHQLISCPYMAKVRGQGTDGQSALNLGPLHNEICSHCQALIDKADAFLEDLVAKKASLPNDYCFGGHQFTHLGAIDAVSSFVQDQLDRTLVHRLLITFLQGALATWVRFSAEFAPGGLIDSASVDFRLSAWMPPTNDHNEGLLGLLRRTLRVLPRLGLHQFNSMVMWHQNNTDSFMSSDVWTSEDDSWVRKQARGLLESKPEQRRCRQLFIHHQQKLQSARIALKRRETNRENQAR